MSAVRMVGAADRVAVKDVHGEALRLLKIICRNKLDTEGQYTAVAMPSRIYEQAHALVTWAEQVGL